MLEKQLEREEAAPSAVVDAEQAHGASFETVSLRGKSARRTGATTNVANVDDDEEVFDLDPELLVNLLGVYSNKMEVWGCSADAVEAFINHVCEETQLPKSYQAQLQAKLAVKKTVANMQKARLARKERRRTRAESLLQPVKSGRVRSGNVQAKK